jgi:hypothetical protein
LRITRHNLRLSQNKALLRVLAASILWCGSLPKLAAQNSATQEQSNSVHGIVVNRITHEPIGQALVFSPDNRFATMTDDQGHFEFVLPPSEVSSAKAQLGGPIPASNRLNQLMARKPGFLEGDNPQQNGVIAPEQKEVSLSLTPEALIVGKVALPDDADKIVVELYRRDIQEGHARWMSAGATEARSNGEFRFANLPAGKYKILTRESLDRDTLALNLHTQLYGYPPVFFPAAPDLATAATIELAAGNTFQASLAPIRQAYYQVSVPVANVPNLTALSPIVFVQGHPGPGFSLGYNQQTHSIEGMLPDGLYTVEAFSQDYAALTGTQNFTVKGAAVQAPVMMLTPRVSIGVNVREEFTANSPPLPPTNNFEVRGPRRYLSITLWPAAEFGYADAAIMGQGAGPEGEALTIPNVQPGAYWVQVNSTKGFPASITSGGTDLLHHPFVVGLGGATLPIEIAMRDDWAHFTANLEAANEAGAPSNARAEVAEGINAPAWVYLVPLADSPGQFQQILLTSTGTSADINVSPGEYRVLAFDRPSAEIEYRNPEAMRAYDGVGQVVRFAAGQKEHVTLSVIFTSAAP